jgi:hypothetical protein
MAGPCAVIVWSCRLLQSVRCCSQFDDIAAARARGGGRQHRNSASHRTVDSRHAARRQSTENAVLDKKAQSKMNGKMVFILDTHKNETKHYNDA